MNLLIKSARIIKAEEPANDKTFDIYIEDGGYKNIALAISQTDCKKGTIVFDAKGKCISIGWFDLRANFREPGFERKETIISGINAAIAGGFTGVALMPSVNPVLQTRADIEFVISKSHGAITDIYPMGALTLNRDGKDITEMYDMKCGGAVAFTDDDRFVKDSGVMLRAMQYVQQINSKIVTYCDDTGLSGNNSTNESANTALLGFKGAPAIAEEIALERDLSLCRYSGVSIHISGISTKGSVDIIRKAKKEGQPITCEVDIHHLMLNDAALSEFDTNYKVKPPLRSKDDTDALIKGVVDGIIDAIVSNHSPEDIESKNVEWDFASYGSIGLESCFGVMNTVLSGKMNLSQLIEKITVNPRKILGIEVPVIKTGEKANFTIFDPELEWTFGENNIKSLSKNTPYIGRKLKGKVIAVGNKDLFESLT